MVEEAGDGDCVFALIGTLCVDSRDAVIDLSCRAGYCFQHGVTTESVEIGTGKCEWEMASDTWQRERWRKSEPGKYVSMCLSEECGGVGVSSLSRQGLEDGSLLFVCVADTKVKHLVESSRS